MSIMFLEPVYPEPGRGHRGQLQLVEVRGAGPGPGRPASLRPAGPRGSPPGSPLGLACVFAPFPLGRGSKPVS